MACLWLHPRLRPGTAVVVCSGSEEHAKELCSKRGAAQARICTCPSRWHPGSKAPVCLPASSMEYDWEPQGWQSEVSGA